MERIELIISIIIVVVLAIYYIIKAIRENWVKKLYDTVAAAVKEAEASGKTGEEKKLLVLNAVELKCSELGIPYRLVHRLISKLIDNIIKSYNSIIK